MRQTTYDLPLSITYTIAAAAIDTASADLLSVAGPAGMSGRVDSIVAVNTAAVTGAASLIRVGDDSDNDKFATLSVPVSADNAVTNNFTGLTTDDNLIPADSRVIISTDGGATAGDANLFVTISWF